MVLVDTSIWIRFLANREPFARGLDLLLEHDDALGHEFVEGELLIGDRGGRPALLADYALLTRAPLLANKEVSEFVRARRLHGRGIGWIDAHLLASAPVANAPLWTADASLAAIAAELNVGYAVEH